MNLGRVEREAKGFQGGREEKGGFGENDRGHTGSCARPSRGKACGPVNRRRQSAAAAVLLQVPRSWKRTSLGGLEARTGDPRGAKAPRMDAGLFRLFDLFGIRAQRQMGPVKGAKSDDVSSLEGQFSLWCATCIFTEAWRLGRQATDSRCLGTFSLLQKLCRYCFQSSTSICPNRDDVTRYPVRIATGTLAEVECPGGCRNICRQINTQGKFVSFSLESS